MNPVRLIAPAWNVEMTVVGESAERVMSAMFAREEGASVFLNVPGGIVGMMVVEAPAEAVTVTRHA